MRLYTDKPHEIGDAIEHASSGVVYVWGIEPDGYDVKSERPCVRMDAAGKLYACSLTHRHQ